MKKTLLWAGALLGLTLILAWPDSVRDSKHNLSSSGPGAIRTDDTTEICIFCHTSHNAASVAPLWNREDSTVIYSLYDSSTLYSTPDQPDGASKLCLSCHDGTIALGKIVYPPENFNMLSTLAGKIPPGEVSNLGSDLSDDHPISFDPSPAVAESSELSHPDPLDKVGYDASGKIQCTSCHNPHDNVFSKFLAKSNLNAVICKTCHVLSAFNQESIHDLSGKPWNGTGEDPWPHTSYTTVSSNSCMNCHRSHMASGKERLLNQTEEDVCLICHNGNLGKNIETQLSKTSAHRVDLSHGHDPTEDILTAPVHVECVDCHNPHQIRNTGALAPDVNGNQIGVSGMTITGSLVEVAQYQYEVCFKCHGQNQYIVTTPMDRMFDTGNIRFVFNPSNTSYHAVTAQGTGTWVPSLIPPYSTSSRLYCTDCHNSDSSTGGGGGPGARGPHGSNFDYLLERRYETEYYNPWSVDSYALCYKCHNSNTLFDEYVSGFEDHEKHIREENTGCFVCHDPHGSPDYIALLNFDKNVVFPNSNGELRFEILGDKGYCFLDCHGKDHNHEDYTRK